MKFKMFWRRFFHIRTIVFLIVFLLEIIGLPFIFTKTKIIDFPSAYVALIFGSVSIIAAIFYENIRISYLNSKMDISFEKRDLKSIDYENLSFYDLDTPKKLGISFQDIVSDIKSGDILNIYEAWNSKLKNKHGEIKLFTIKNESYFSLYLKYTNSKKEPIKIEAGKSIHLLTREKTVIQLLKIDKNSCVKRFYDV